MGDRKVTLFELHFDGPLRIGPSFGSDPEPDVESTSAESTVESDGGTTERESASAEDESASTDEGGAPVKGAILGILAIVALAVAARVLLGEEDVDEPELVELDDSSDVEVGEDDDAE